MKLDQDSEVITKIKVLVNGLELVKEDHRMIPKNQENNLDHIPETVKNLISQRKMTIVNLNLNHIIVEKKKKQVVLNKEIIQKILENLKKFKEAVVKNR